jgi:hypothetical protein
LQERKREKLASCRKGISQCVKVYTANVVYLLLHSQLFAYFYAREKKKARCEDDEDVFCYSPSKDAEQAYSD